MRDKDKVNLTGQICHGAFDKLKKISEDKKISRIKVIEYLIENYQPAGTKELIAAPVFEVVKEKPKPLIKKEQILPPPPSKPKFNLAAELAKYKT